MCFSATASFGAAAVLAPLGILTLKKTKTWRELPLAAFPLLFALQQATEGALWLNFLHGDAGTLRQALTIAYAVFAGIVWPLAAPAAVLLAEPEERRRRVMAVPLALGVGVAAYTLRALPGIESTVANQCIRYDYPAGWPSFLLAAYVAATLGAFFISSLRWLNLLSVVYGLGFIATYYAYAVNFISGWCFLAAITSGILYLHFSGARVPDSGYFHRKRTT